MLKFGDRVTWTYDHCLGRSYTTRTKIGTFRGPMKHSARWWRKPGRVQMALVDFDGNRHVSLVKLSELRRVEKETKDGE